MNSSRNGRVWDIPSEALKSFDKKGRSELATATQGSIGFEWLFSACNA